MMGGVNCPPVDATASTAPANCDGPGGGNIRHGRAVDHAHQGRGDDRHLGRPARRPSHQRQGDVVDEPRKAAVLQESPEQDKDEDIGGGYPAARAQDSDGIPDQRLDHPFQRKCRRAEGSGDVAPPQGKIGEEDQCNNSKVPACPACRLKRDDQAHDPDPHIGVIEPACFCQGVVSPQNIPKADNRSRAEQHVPDRRHPAASLLRAVCRIEQKGERKQDHNMCGAELHGAKCPGQIRPQLKECKSGQDHGQCRLHPADIGPGAAVGLGFFHQLLRFSVRLRALLRQAVHLLTPGFALAE